MRATSALLFIAAWLVAAPAALNAESDTPMRSAGAPIETAKTMNEVQACAVRDVAHNGKPVVVPIENGVEIDQLAETLLTKPTDPRFRVRITDLGAARRMEMFYRHPVSAKFALKRLESIRRKCEL